jgi:hypothetical protein
MSESKRPIRPLRIPTLSPRASHRSSLRTPMRHVPIGRIKVIPEIAETLGGRMGAKSVFSPNVRPGIFFLIPR